MLSTFSKMADMNVAKGKELLTTTVGSHFNKLTWRQLVGLESISLFLSSPSVLSCIATVDSGMSVSTALDTIVRIQS